MDKIRLLSLFAGIGAMEEGAKRVFDVEIVAAAEIDKYARISYQANHTIDDNHFYKDVKLLDGKDYINKYDCLCFGFPCQDYSMAGKRAGLEGQRGTLFYEAARILRDSKPPFFIAENVKGLLSSHGGKDFETIISILREIGYSVYYDVVNSKDYGVPQNRERIFLVGFLDKTPYYRFNFADKIPLDKKLKDVLEKNVSDKFVLKKKQILSFTSGKSMFKERFKPIDPNKQDYAVCLDCKCGGGRRTSNFLIEQIEQKVSKNISPSIRENFIRDYEKIITCENSVFYSECNSAFQDNKVCIAEAATLRANNNNNIFCLDEYSNIRRLTPLECFRLQDFSDEFFYKCKNKGISDTQLYKQAGNSITVAVAQMIFNQMKQKVNKVYNELKKDYWQRAFKLNEIKKYLSSKKVEELNCLLNRHSIMDFTKANLHQFVVNLINGFPNMIDDAILHMFDQITKYALREKCGEYGGNIHYYNGWKTNKAFKINKKVILPFYSRFGDFYDLDFDQRQFFDDLQIIIDYFNPIKQEVKYDGNGFEIKPLSVGEEIYNTFVNKKESKNIKTKYFEVTFYQKKTMHIKFTDENILRSLNIFVAQKRGWLPMDYGYKPKTELNHNEKELVNNFEGEKNYKQRGELLFIETPKTLMIGL